MQTLTFTIRLHRHGVVLREFKVAAEESGFVGVWKDGKPYQPVASEVRKALPSQYRKAFDRAHVWWSDWQSPNAPMRRDMRTLRGHHPMGTLIASGDWLRALPDADRQPAWI